MSSGLIHPESTVVRPRQTVLRTIALPQQADELMRNTQGSATFGRYKEGTGCVDQEHTPVPTEKENRRASRHGEWPNFMECVPLNAARQKEIAQHHFRWNGIRAEAQVRLQSTVPARDEYSFLIRFLSVILYKLFAGARDGRDSREDLITRAPTEKETHQSRGVCLRHSVFGIGFLRKTGGGLPGGQEHPYGARADPTREGRRPTPGNDYS